VIKHAPAEDQRGTARQPQVRFVGILAVQATMPPKKDGKILRAKRDAYQKLISVLSQTCKPVDAP
jgi:hypothetical protein